MELKNMQKVFLITLGRCGSRFLHGLIDGHPQVISFPQSFNPYNCFSISKKWNENAKNWSERIMEHFTNISWAYNKHVTKGFGNFSDFQGNSKIFKEHLLHSLDSEMSAQDFFYSFHEAYLKSLGEKSVHKTHIFSHIHNFKYVEEIQNDFPMAKWIVMVRNPCAMMQSHYEEQLLKNHLQDKLLAENWWQGMNKFLEAIKLSDQLRKKVGESNFKYIKIENLHTNKDQEIKELIKWMGLSEHESLTKCTLGGADYQFIPRKNSVVQGSRPRKITNKRKNLFTEEDSLIVEKIFEKFMLDLNYPLKNSEMNFSKKIWKIRIAGDKKFSFLKSFVMRPWVEDLGINPQFPIKKDPIRLNSVKRSFVKWGKEFIYLFNRKNVSSSKKLFWDNWRKWNEQNSTHV